MINPQVDHLWSISWSCPLTYKNEFWTGPKMTSLHFIFSFSGSGHCTNLSCTTDCSCWNKNVSFCDPPGYKAISSADLHTDWAFAPGNRPPSLKLHLLTTQGHCKFTHPWWSLPVRSLYFLFSLLVMSIYLAFREKKKIFLNSFL